VNNLIKVFYFPLDVFDYFIDCVVAAPFCS